MQKQAGAHTPCQDPFERKMSRIRAFFCVSRRIHSDAVHHLRSHLKHLVGQHAQLEYVAGDELSLFLPPFFQSFTTATPSAMQDKFQVK